MKKITYREIILASTSPRRIEILGNTGILFRVEASEYEEDMTLPMQEFELVKHLAYGKAKEVSNRFPKDLVVGGDTFVVHEGKFLGKPKTNEEAKDMLQVISDETVSLVSGISILHKDSGFEKSFHEVTMVTLRKISVEAIDAYVATKIPLDRAGAFGVQDIGSKFISQIQGDYYNVLGLPLFRLLDELYAIDPDLMKS